jgi:hypothetical protein
LAEQIGEINQKLDNLTEAIQHLVLASQQNATR